MFAQRATARHDLRQLAVAIAPLAIGSPSFSWAVSSSKCNKVVKVLPEVEVVVIAAPSD